MAREHAQHRLARLIEISRLLMGAIGPDDLLRAIFDAVTDLLACEGCSIALIDESAQELAFTSIIGAAGVEGIRLALGQGIAGFVAASGESVISNDVGRDPRFFSGVDAATGFKTRSILCVPLRQRDQLIGSLEAINTGSPDGFSAEDRELLAAFAGLAATAINRSRAFAALSNAKTALQEHVEDRYDLVAGHSPVLREAVETARTAASARTTVLLLGESGVGKEVLARAIHRWSPRVDGPFVAVNCVALTPELLESELFGHERGAFTGAIAQKKGKFELAEGGTVFLDEIGDLALGLQAKLLRVLQEREFQRVGGVRDVRVDVRVVAATNRDLREAIHAGRFREDLYYRLNVVAITIPPLRERTEDIPALAERFLIRFSREMNRPPHRLADDALRVLMAHDWPGNVRELQNAIERAVVLASGPVLSPRDFHAEIRGGATHSAEDREVPSRPERAQGTGDAAPARGGSWAERPLHEAVDDLKRAHIRAALAQSGGNQTRAAALLGMRQSNLSRLMKSLGLG